MHNVKLRNMDGKKAEDNMDTKFVTWHDRFMSYGAKLVFLRSCLSSIPYCMMSVFPFPYYIVQNNNMKRLLWQDSDESHKYTLVKWEEVYQHVDQGGLGLVGLGIMNVCVLSK